MIKIIKELFQKKEISIFCIIIVISIILGFLNSVFLSLDNIMDVTKGNVVLGIMALGMLPVLISGGIDLSVSSTIALSAVVVGKILTMFTSNIFVLILACIIVGASIGFMNGIIITKLQIPPIVTTLGMMTIILGFVLFYTKGNWITNLPPSFNEFGAIRLFGFIPIQLLFFLIAAAITFIMLKYTIIGRGIYAIGGNMSSSIRVGYNVEFIQIFIYVFCGIMSAVAAIVHTSIVQQVDPNTFTGLELNVITAVVIGGASTMGGFGTVSGTILGVILLSIIKNGLVLAKIPTFWQKIVMGLIIIIAVSIDVMNKKREQEKLQSVDVEE